MKRSSSSSSLSSSSFETAEPGCSNYHGTHPPTSLLEAPISPPPFSNPAKRQRRTTGIINKVVPETDRKQVVPSNPTFEFVDPKPAAIEAGQIQIDNHLEYFSSRLARCVRPPPPRCAARSLLSIERFEELYRRNQHARGNHFVVHQHDHPVAGRSLCFYDFSRFLFRVYPSLATMHSLFFGGGGFCSPLKTCCSLDFRGKQ